MSQKYAFHLGRPVVGTQQSTDLPFNKKSINSLRHSYRRKQMTCLLVPYQHAMTVCLIDSCMRNDYNHEWKLLKKLNIHDMFQIEIYKFLLKDWITQRTALTNIHINIFPSYLPMLVLRKAPPHCCFFLG